MIFTDPSVVTVPLQKPIKSPKSPAGPHVGISIVILGARGPLVKNAKFSKVVISARALGTEPNPKTKHPRSAATRELRWKEPTFNPQINCEILSRWAEDPGTSLKNYRNFTSVCPFVKYKGDNPTSSAHSERLISIFPQILGAKPALRGEA